MSVYKKSIKSNNDNLKDINLNDIFCSMMNIKKYED